MKDKIEISEYNGEGYKGVVSYQSWRVAILNYIDELLPEKIKSVQAHLKSDEVFVLLEGQCILFTVDIQDSTISNVEAIDMKQGKVYNVKKGVYHTHTLSEDGKVLIVENDNTCLENSPIVMTNRGVNATFSAIKQKLWG